MFLFPLFYVIREFHRFLHRGKAETCNECQAQEQSLWQRHCFTSNWLRKRRNFSQPVTESNKAKLKRSKRKLLSNILLLQFSRSVVIILQTLYCSGCLNHLFFPTGFVILWSTTTTFNFLARLLSTSKLTILKHLIFYKAHFPQEKYWILGNYWPNLY